MKKLISLLLCLSILLSMSVSAAATESNEAEETTEEITAEAETYASYSGTCGDNVTWTLSNGTLTISGKGAMEDYEMDDLESIYVVPWYSYIDSISTVKVKSGVTSIGNYTFYGFDSLTGVTISDSVASIGDYAFFGCNSLTSVTIPDSVTSIGDYAFACCDNLTSVTIPSNVTSIGDAAFFECESLTSITIPDSVTSIGERAFDTCNSLTSVTIPDSVTSIGGGAFSDCYSLTSIKIPASVKNIEYNPFYGCGRLESLIVDSANPYYCSEDGVLFNKDKTKLITYLTTKEGAYVIPDSVTTIGVGAFRECELLGGITIPDSVTSIGDCAFFGCNSLTSVTIPDSVVSIGEGTFWVCWNLTSVTIPKSITTIGYCAFSACGVTDVYYGGTAADRENITIDNTENGNNPLLNATWHYAANFTAATEDNSGLNAKAEIPEGILSAEELEEITSSDTSIKVSLKIESASLTEESKQQIEQAAEKATGSDDVALVYVDISLVKTKTAEGKTTASNISETNEAITITLQIPKALQGMDVYTVICVHEGTVSVITPTVNKTANTLTFQANQFSTYAIAGAKAEETGETVSTIAITRLYNPATGEHLLASSDAEINSLTSVGWSVDGVMCTMPTSGTPIYRLYNPTSGEHLYTMVTSEIENLKSGGWNVDGVIAYSAGSDGTPIYRLYNANAAAISSHLLSTSQEEINSLKAAGWTLEGIALFASK